jgi:hypothetical protein
MTTSREERRGGPTDQALLVRLRAFIDSTATRNCPEDVKEWMIQYTARMAARSLRRRIALGDMSRATTFRVNAARKTVLAPEILDFYSLRIPLVMERSTV